MAMNKKIKTVIAAALMTVMAAAAGIAVYAYLQKPVEQQNRFSIGEDSVTISESFSEPDTMSMTDTFTKEVSVTNTGTSDQFVRVYLDFSDSSIRDNAEIVYTKNGSTQTKSWEEFLADLPDGWEYIPESGDPDSSTLGGYFYYKEILAPTYSTTKLIEGVNTDFREGDNDSNTDRITDFDIIVYTESVQTVETGTGREYTADDRRTAWKSFLAPS